MRLQSVLAGFTTGFRVSLLRTVLAAQILVTGGLLTLPSQASQRLDGRVQFNQPPVLVEQPTLELNSNRRAYTFSIQVPNNAGAAMIGILLEQSDDESLDFDLSQTEAFLLGPSANRAAELDLQSVEQIAPDQIQIRFAEPVNPGTTVTIALEPRHIPRGSNSYQIGVSALPVATNAAEFLGYQQINTCRSRYDEEIDRRVLFWDLPPEFDPRVRNNPCRR